MKKMSNMPLIIGFCIVLVSVLVYYTLQKPQTQPSSVEKTQQNLYQNNVLNYSIEVPTGWIVEDNLGAFLSIPGEVTFTYPNENPNSIFSNVLAIYGSKERVENRLPYTKSFAEALAENNSEGTGLRTFKLANTKIDGKDAVQFINRTLEGDATESFYSVITWIVDKDINYYFEFMGSNEAFIKDNMDLYNQILSTFRFNN